VPDVRLVGPCLIAALTALAVTGARGQQDLDAGKTGPQLFAQDCSACHRSPQGLVKSLGAGSLVGFLRQHYTSSSASANVVAAYLQTVGGGPRAGQKDRPERQKDQKDQAKQAQPQPPAAQPPAAQPPDRAKIARPSEPIPSPAQPEVQPAPGAKKRERLARPLDPAANPQAPANSQGRRKSRRPVHAEPATTPGVEVPATQNGAPASADGAPRAAASGGREVAAPRSAGPAQPSFVEPLP
jgi:hypothetical protein